MMKTEENLSPQPVSNDELDEILSGLSLNERRFVIARAECKTDKEAAEAIGLSPTTVWNWNNKEVIRRAVEIVQTEAERFALDMRHRALPKAMATKIAGLESEDESIRQKAATEIVEWELGKATQRSELSGGIDIRDGLTVEERAARAAALFDEARARRTGRTTDANDTGDQ